MRVLIIAPHLDDEVLGCGGLIAKRVKRGDVVTVCFVIKGSSRYYSQDRLEQGVKEAKMAHIMLGVQRTIFLNMTSFIDKAYPLNDITDKLSEVIRREKPEEVYIPFHNDIHIDHCNVAKAALVALRPKPECRVKRIYEYETISETGWNFPTKDNAFTPDVYEDISGFLNVKEDALRLYKSQIQEFPGTRSVLGSTTLAVHRGTTIGVPAAEAFKLVREVR